jgi:hypothetical protein
MVLKYWRKHQYTAPSEFGRPWSCTHEAGEYRFPVDGRIVH